jgi:hypothetical protein
MWEFITEHWIISSVVGIVAYTAFILFLARFCGFNNLDADND